MNSRGKRHQAGRHRLQVTVASVVGLCLFAVSPALLVGGADSKEDGHALAAELREQSSIAQQELSGQLIRESSDGRIVRSPVRMVTQPMPGGFRTVYQGDDLQSGVPTTLTIVRVNGEIPGYLLSRQMDDSGQVGPPTYLSGPDAMRPFAGSDFWLADLGFDFFYWPGQKLLRRQMTRGRACDVLESSLVRVEGEGYVRVLSWIDRETRGVVKAEAYGADGEVLKEFKPKEFKKIDGRWQVRELEITNERSGSRTRLVLDLTR